MDRDRVWTHLSDAQAEGEACVMCGRPTTTPGWRGATVGRSEAGSPVYACSGDDRPAITGDERGKLAPTGHRPVGRACVDDAAVVVPEAPDELEL